MEQNRSSPILIQESGLQIEIRSHCHYSQASRSSSPRISTTLPIPAQELLPQAAAALSHCTAASRASTGTEQGSGCTVCAAQNCTRRDFWWWPSSPARSRLIKTFLANCLVTLLCSPDSMHCQGLPEAHQSIRINQGWFMVLSAHQNLSQHYLVGTYQVFQAVFVKVPIFGRQVSLSPLVINISPLSHTPLHTPGSSQITSVQGEGNGFSPFDTRYKLFCTNLVLFL